MEVAFYLRARRQKTQLLSLLKRIWRHAFATQYLGLFRDVLAVVPAQPIIPTSIPSARMAQMLWRPDQSTAFWQRAEQHMRASVEADHHLWAQTLATWPLRLPALNPVSRAHGCLCRSARPDRWPWSSATRFVEDPEGAALRYRFRPPTPCRQELLSNVDGLAKSPATAHDGAMIPS